MLNSIKNTVQGCLQNATNFEHIDSPVVQFLPVYPGKQVQV